MFSTAWQVLPVLRSLCSNIDGQFRWRHLSLPWMIKNTFDHERLKPDFKKYMRAVTFPLHCLFQTLYIFFPCQTIVLLFSIYIYIYIYRFLQIFPGWIFSSVVKIKRGNACRLNYHTDFSVWKQDTSVGRRTLFCRYFFYWP